MTHSPTPWKIEHDDTSFVIVNANGYPVCRTAYDNTRDKDNAQLLVSAPELLEACKKFVKSFKSLQREKCETARNVAIAAIAIAERKE